MPRGGKREGAGRPIGSKTKSGGELRELAQQYTDEALKTLATVMRGGEGVPAAAQVSAAKELLDRGYGKATQPISGDDEASPIKTVTRIERAIIDPADTDAA